ncbi:AbrB family transcriptional regulator [Mesorhizobium sp. WSM3224]|uniref:AbrB family transcriptional regulator n=1 Tax=Mesorhizobium sp. WSM3224 TaxID=1040986 RepID=UPI0009FC9DA5|nr:AbrB family transcriptional regulator [Mesorhizobium sp. WSM3224]
MTIQSGRWRLRRLLTTWRDGCRIAEGILVAVFGGLAFSWVGLPAPWLTGGIFFAAAAALVSPVASPPNWLNGASMMVLGVSVGSRITGESLANALSWPASLFAMSVTVVGMFAGSYCLLRCVFRWDAASAFWASPPGAVGLALSMASQTDADLVKVSMVQLTRVIATMILLPVTLGESSLSQAFPPIGSLWLTTVLLAGCYCVGFTAEKVGIPAGMLIGGIAGSAILLWSGFFVSASPNIMITPACVVISASVGSRFSGVQPNGIKRLVLPSIASMLVAVSVGFSGGLVVTQISGLPLQQVLIAYAPGGLDALIAASILLGADSLFVAAHQIARFVLLSVFLPIAGRIHERTTRIDVE